MLLALWEAASALGWLRPFQFPPPSRSPRASWSWSVDGFPDGIAHLGSTSLVTVARILTGFALAIALAIPLGLLDRPGRRCSTS